MVHRITSIAFAIASILVSNAVANLEIKGLRVSKEAKESENVDGWFKVEKEVEKGAKCKAHADKTKGAGRGCEGGVKQVMSFGIGAKELAEDVSDKVRDLHSEMILPDEKDILVPDDVLSEWMSLDEIDDIFGDEDCSDEGCKKVMEFGGYVKAFWGCNVTFSKDGLKMSKDFTCGFKSFEGMGKKEAAYYNEVQEKYGL
eukprot:CAMPEP_0116081892 /NCGR_PEP_ID=MMETSP0327-20121206/2443_1 /TAXON_ID=44447 /ORGANISM="Pseudo-nitzschia delicatissima, Strain B596" /LENGTH=199 /DNA_ID=CAMNT_0003572665 /DNA_START=225 /DNA_END=824 /DNA_ORIENTATION=+